MSASTMLTLLPPNPSFAGHQTFSMRSGWLKKGLDALQTPESGGNSVFTREDALVTLGVGKNMVQSIRHWLLVTGMAAEKIAGSVRILQPSALGTALFGAPDVDGWDPYLEDEATLWLLHWQLAGPGSLAFSWIWAFSFFREHEYSKEILAEAVMAGASHRVPKVPSKETLVRDIDCLLHTYVMPENSPGGEDSLDCPLQSLGLIQPAFDKRYRFAIGPKGNLPRRLFVYALLRYWEWKETDVEMPVWDITYGEGSPGAVFKLDEDTVLEYLDDLERLTNGAYRFEDTPLMRQVVRQPDVVCDPISLLRGHYHA